MRAGPWAAEVSNLPINYALTASVVPWGPRALVCGPPGADPENRNNYVVTAWAVGRGPWAVGGGPSGADPENRRNYVAAAWAVGRGPHRKSTRLNSSHGLESRMQSAA